MFSIECWAIGGAEAVGILLYWAMDTSDFAVLLAKWLAAAKGQGLLRILVKLLNQCAGEMDE